MTSIITNKKEIKLCNREDYERVSWGEYFDGLSKINNYCLDNLKNS